MNQLQSGLQSGVREFIVVSINVIWNAVGAMGVGPQRGCWRGGEGCWACIGIGAKSEASAHAAHCTQATSRREFIAPAMRPSASCMAAAARHSACTSGATCTWRKSHWACMGSNHGQGGHPKSGCELAMGEP